MSDLFVFNGIDARTGGYLLPPMNAEALAAVARGHGLPPEELEDLQRKLRHARVASYGPAEGIDPKDLSQTGWGVVFPAVKPNSKAAKRQAAIVEALRPLLDLRKAQAAAQDERFYREYIGADGYRPGESKRKFLARHGAGPGPADPAKVPYYLLIVGTPEEVPFRVQSQIDVQYAVGRLDLPTVQAFAYYAESVVRAETGGLALPRRAAFFGVANPQDPATALSAQHLVAPLAEWARGDQPEWAIEHLEGEAASKARLAALVGGAETPALLFTGSHGMGFPSEDVQQMAHQGALLCGDWPGPQDWQDAIPQDFYLAADDVGDDARLHGLLAFNFACFGAGTPAEDEFAKQAMQGRRKRLAPQAFTSALPQRMLAHPAGGALAVIGHVDRAWGCSFVWEDGSRRGAQRRQLGVFQSTLKRLFEGHPVGSAVEYFDERYAELSTELTDLIEEAEYGEPIDDFELAGLWTANNDARGYAILGDPAVRMAVAPEGEGLDRAVLEVASGPARPVTAPTPDSTFIEDEDDDDEDDGVDAPGPAADGPEDEDGVVADGDQSFGWFGNEGKAADAADEPGVFARFSKKVTDTLSAALQDALSLEIRTFVTDDVAGAARASKADLPNVAELKAYTRFHIDGDLDLLVPHDDGRVDEALWAVHKEMVEQAREHRIEMIQTVLSLVTGTTPNKK